MHMYRQIKVTRLKEKSTKGLPGNDQNEEKMRKDGKWLHQQIEK